MTPRTTARGGRQAKQENAAQRQHDYLKSEGVLSDGRALGQELKPQAWVCPVCGELVYPTNWDKHQGNYHAGHEAPYPERISPWAIEALEEAQPRACLDAATVNAYAEDMQAGAVFPAVELYMDAEHIYLADGFHRVAAARACGLESIPANIRLGTLRDAILYAAGANAGHGLRRTNADKRRAVESLLNDSEWAQWADREIARICNVSHPTVSKIRAHLAKLPDGARKFSRTVNGKTYTYVMDTANLRPALSEDAPPWLHMLLDNAEIDTKRALGVDADYKSAPRYIQEVANLHLVTGPGVLPLLATLGASYPLEFEELAATGFLAGEIPLMECNARDIEHYLDKLDHYNKEEDADKPNPEMLTPAVYLEAARLLMDGIDLDPASSKAANALVQSRVFYSPEENGLIQPWSGNVWLCPPTDNPKEWANKLFYDYEAGKVQQAVMLLDSKHIGAEWFQPFFDYALCVTDHKIHFLGDDKPVRFSAVFVYMAYDPGAFNRLFSDFGPILERVLEGG